MILAAPDQCPGRGFLQDSEGTVTTGIVEGVDLVVFGFD